MLIIYSKKNCVFCDRAKALLGQKNIEFQEVRVDEDESAKDFIVSQGHRTVPQIYLDGKLLVENGFQGLARFTDSDFQKLKEQINVS